jgi:hypothetical protein
MGRCFNFVTCSALFWTWPFLFLNYTADCILSCDVIQMKILTFKGMSQLHTVIMRISLTHPVVKALYNDLVVHCLDFSNAHETRSLPSVKVIPSNMACNLFHSSMWSSLNCLLNWISHCPSAYTLATSISGLEEIWYKLWNWIFKGHSPNQQSCQNLVYCPLTTSITLPLSYHILMSNRDLQNWDPYLFLI